MKIALCLSGYFNSSRDNTSLGSDGFNHIKKHILDSNDVDVYIHTWDIEHLNIIHTLYSPWIRSLVAESQIDFKPVFIQNGLDTIPIEQGRTPFWNVFSQYYSVQKSFQLMMNTSVEYDCVIKARFDLGRINRLSSGPHNPHNPYAVQCINFNPSFDMNQLYMADWQYLDTEGPPDMWFYSNKNNMSKFATIFDTLSTDIRINSEYQEWAGSHDGGMINTIKGWKWFLIKTGLWDKKVSLPTYWE